MRHVTWEEVLASIPVKRALMKKYGLDAPSRRTVSYNTSERHMREAFGGGRIPKWAEKVNTNESSANTH